MARQPVISKGGDGGAFVPRARPRHWDDNARVCLTGDSLTGEARRAFLSELKTTADPCDRAHKWRVQVAGVPPELDESRVYPTHQELRARFVGRPMPGQLRRYHPSQMVGDVGIDSAYDRAALTAHRLQEELGIDLGWRTNYPRDSARRSRGVCSVNVERANQVAAMGADARSVLRKRTRSVCTAEERALCEAGSVLLRRARDGETQRRRDGVGG